MSEIMTPEHPKWSEFCDRLLGVHGCRFRENKRGQLKWRCNGDHEYATAILSTMPKIDIAASLELFEQHGGYCDCEILFNVEDNCKGEPCTK